MDTRFLPERLGRLNRKSWSMRAKLTALFILGGLLPTLAFSYYVYCYSHQLIVKKENAAIKTSIEAAEASISEILRGMENGMQEVLSFPIVREALESTERPPSVEWFYRTKRVEEMLKAITNSNQLPYSITIIGANGSFYSNGLLTNLYEKFNGPLAQKVIGYQWRNVVLKRVGGDGTDIITMGKSIKYGGKPAGVILFDIPMDRVRRFFSEEDALHMNVFGLYEGRELFYSISNSISEEYFMENSDRILESGQELIPIAGKSYLCTVNRFSGNYTLTVLTPADYIFADSHLYITQGILIGVLVAVQMFIYSWVIARLFTRRIKSLHKSVRRFAKDMTPIALANGSADEIGQLTAEFSRMSSEITAMVEQLKRNGKERKRLEMAALRSQFDPHMLYNTLNTITYLAKLQEIPNIQEVSEAFSRLLRVLAQNADEFVPIRQELSYIADYVTIKKYNLLNEITLSVSVEEGLEDKPIIKLLLQPFVENAIVHGFSNMVRPAQLEIHVFKREGYLHVRIADNGHGIEPEQLQRLLEAADSPQASDHIGISNTVRRFALTYEFHTFFDIQSERERYTIIELAYPDQSKESAADAQGIAGGRQ